MIRLSVNVNKIALLRNARGGTLPDVVAAARTCIAAGCHGITVHPRPDARHITFQDVHDLAAMLTVEFNIEGYPSPEFLQLVHKVKPTQVTLVPDAPGLLTSNAGWNLARGGVDWIRAFDASSFPVRIAAEVKDFDASGVASPKGGSIPAWCAISTMRSNWDRGNAV